MKLKQVKIYLIAIIFPCLEITKKVSQDSLKIMDTATDKNL